MISGVNLIHIKQNDKNDGITKENDTGYFTRKQDVLSFR